MTGWMKLFLFFDNYNEIKFQNEIRNIFFKHRKNKKIFLT